MLLAESYIFTSIFVTLLALCVGSFLNVCIYRIPRAANFYADEEELDDIREAEAKENANLETGDINSSGEHEPLEGANIVAKETNKPASEPLPPPPPFNDPPRSFCPKCNNMLLWWHNLPLVSWLILGGKCYFCKDSISVRYPLVELLTAVFGYLCFYYFGFSVTALLIFIFICSLIVMSFIDYDYYILPNVITYPSFFIGLILVVINHFIADPYSKIFKFPFCEDLWGSLYGFLAGAGFLYAISTMYLLLRKREGLGMGDVKLLAVVGVMFGPSCSFYTIFIGSLVGSVFGILMMLVMGRNFEKHIPFGPYLAVGTICYIFGWVGFFPLF